MRLYHASPFNIATFGHEDLEGSLNEHQHLRRVGLHLGGYQSAVIFRYRYLYVCDVKVKKPLFGRDIADWNWYKARAWGLSQGYDSIVYENKVERDLVPSVYVFEPKDQVTIFEKYIVADGELKLQTSL